VYSIALIGRNLAVSVEGTIVDCIIESASTAVYNILGQMPHDPFFNLTRESFRDSAIRSEFACRERRHDVRPHARSICCRIDVGHIMDMGKGCDVTVPLMMVLLLIFLLSWPEKPNLNL
jgi:hypothetical protein